MKPTGIVKAVDKMGRITIPKEIRAQLQIENDIDSVELFFDGERVIIQKYCPACIFCDSLIDNMVFEGRTVCKSCIEKMNLLKDNI